MELKHVAAISALLAVFLFPIVGYCSCGVPSQCRPNPCADSISECQCTDPACRADTTCLSRARCCHYFGNVGADGPSDSDP